MYLFITDRLHKPNRYLSVSITKVIYVYHCLPHIQNTKFNVFVNKLIYFVIFQNNTKLFALFNK